jgi:hypothetical protein
MVGHRLEAAGMTLLAMRTPSAYPAGVRSAMPDVLREAIEAYGWTDEPSRAAVPDAAEITRMDVAYGWLRLIPQNRHVLRRIVAARSLVSPETCRHIMTWKRIAVLLGADSRAIKSWHTHGIAIIVGALNHIQLSNHKWQAGFFGESERKCRQ